VLHDAINAATDRTRRRATDEYDLAKHVEAAEIDLPPRTLVSLRFRQSDPRFGDDSDESRFVDFLFLVPDLLLPDFFGAAPFSPVDALVSVSASSRSATMSLKLSATTRDTRSIPSATVDNTACTMNRAFSSASSSSKASSALRYLFSVFLDIDGPAGINGDAVVHADRALRERIATSVDG